MWDITELINVTPPIKSGQMDALGPKGRSAGQFTIPLIRRSLKSSQAFIA